MTEPEFKPTHRAWSGWRFWALAAGIIGLLGAVYWAVVAETWTPLLADVASRDVADITRELEAQKISYRLADEGRTILVPEDQADQARVDLAGSELAMRGQVGFELFNQSDMGLTEFAQKINFQRALQGELSRSILLLEGIKSVRVHLGLPEKGLFRELHAQPKASVAVMLSPGAELTESQVVGIQRMVAGAVPDLVPGAVTVLDGTGRIVSDESAGLPAAVTAGDARLDSVKQRALAAIRSLEPGLGAEVVVSFRPAAQAQQGANHALSARSPLDAAPSAPVDLGQDVNGRPLSIRIMAADQLDPEREARIVRAVAAATGADTAAGDAIAFVYGWASPPATAAATAGDKVVAEKPQQIVEAASGFSPGNLLLAALAVIAAVAAWWSDRRRRMRRTRSLESFAEQLRSRLDAVPVAAQ